MQGLMIIDKLIIDEANHITIIPDSQNVYKKMVITLDSNGGKKKKEPCTIEIHNSAGMIMRTSDIREGILKYNSIEDKPIPVQEGNKEDE